MQNRKIFEIVGIVSVVGSLLFVGVEIEDKEGDADWLTEKIVNLRIISDDKGKMNKSLKDTNQEVLVISQFTLCADTRKGRRPSFVNAESPELSKKLYNKFISCLADKGLEVQSGEFGSNMDVKLLNNGPVTFVLDSKD